MADAFVQGGVKVSVSDEAATEVFTELPWQNCDPLNEPLLKDATTSSDRLADGTVLTTEVATAVKLGLQIRGLRESDGNLTPAVKAVLDDLYAASLTTGIARTRRLKVEFPEGGGWIARYTVGKVTPFGGAITDLAKFEADFSYHSEFEEL